jgi:hypothetical protein
MHDACFALSWVHSHVHICVQFANTPESTGPDADANAAACLVQVIEQLDAAGDLPEVAYALGASAMSLTDRQKRVCTNCRTYPHSINCYDRHIIWLVCLPHVPTGFTDTQHLCLAVLRVCKSMHANGPS